MDIEDDDVTHALDERSRAAAEMLERSLLAAVGRVEAELGRVVSSGEADLERLAGLLVETIARLANAGSHSDGASKEAGSPASPNQIAAMIARAALRGARFS